MVERHSGAKSNVVLITKSSKEQDGYEGTQDRGLRQSPKTPVRRPHRALLGARHTALAAKNELEERKPVSRGGWKKFFGRRGRFGRPAADQFRAGGGSRRRPRPVRLARGQRPR